MCYFFFSIWMLVTQLCPFIHCIHFFKLDVKFHWKVEQKASMWPKKTLSSLMNFQFLFYLTWRHHINQITQTQNQRVISNTFLLLSTQSVNAQSIIKASIYLLNMSWIFLSIHTATTTTVLIQQLFYIFLTLSPPKKSFIQCPSDCSKMQIRCAV